MRDTMAPSLARVKAPRARVTDSTVGMAIGIPPTTITSMLVRVGQPPAVRSSRAAWEGQASGCTGRWKGSTAPCARQAGIPRRTRRAQRAESSKRPAAGRAGSALCRQPKTWATYHLEAQSTGGRQRRREVQLPGGLTLAAVAGVAVVPELHSQLNHHPDADSDQAHRSDAGHDLLEVGLLHTHRQQGGAERRRSSGRHQQAGH